MKDNYENKENINAIFFEKMLENQLNNMKKILFVLAFLVVSISSAQKPKKNAKLKIDVDGVCIMCKKRIETAALKTKGV